MKYLGKIQDNKDLITKEYADNGLADKVDKVSGKGLSTNDYTDSDKSKVASAVQPADLNAYRTSSAQDVIDAGKVDKIEGKGLSENDYTTSEKTKLAGIESGAEVNVQSDWNEADSTKDGYIKNKPTVPTKTSDLTNDSGFIDNTVSNLTNYRTASAQDLIDLGLAGDIDAIESLIPSQATEQNQLADKNFVNSSINSVTAYYITSDAAGNGFESKAALDSATIFYSGGEVRVPTRNDYCIVRVDETKENATTRYIYQNNHWEYQYTVNETALTAAQLAAINSGITAELVTKINGIEAGAEVNLLEGVQINGTDLTITDKKVNIPRATRNSGLGLVRISWYLQSSGINANDGGQLSIVGAENQFITSRHADVNAPILPKNINFAVKSALSDTNRINDMTDTEKGYACNTIGATPRFVKTALDAVLVPFAQYYLGEQTTVALTLPATANAGEQITVVFYSGATATTLTLSGTYLGTLPTPTTNQRIELNLLYDGTNWCLLSNAIATV